MSLSADYTGGIALASLLRGVPIAGIHPCRDDVSAALWLAGMNVRYKSPSTGHLTAICEIDPIQAEEIIFEGCSMYFSESENQNIFRSFLKLMDNPLSCVWADFVNTSVVTGRTNNLRIKGFLEGMDALGEAFIFGTDDPPHWFEALGYSLVDTISAGEYLNKNDAVLNSYSFSVAKR